MKLIMKLTFFAVIISAVFCVLPPNIKKCRAGETECIAKTIQEITREFPKGNEEFKLISLDRLPIKNKVIAGAGDNDGPVQLRFKWIDATLQGMENVIIDRAVGFERDLEHSKFETYSRIPLLIVSGKYEVDGKILLLPITGKGNATIELHNLKCVSKIKVASEMRNGKKYAIIKKYKLHIEPEKMIIQLDNLFNGNKELGKTLNEVINKNWRDIFNVMKPGIEKINEELLTEVTQGVLNDLPYDDFYADE